MPSPFPGMDPFLESQVWQEFHIRFYTELAIALTPLVRPRYVVRIEERIYVESSAGAQNGYIRPDVSVLRSIERRPTKAGTRAAVLDAPMTIPLPVPEEIIEHFLEVRLLETSELVTAIELLSPANKAAGSRGQREYIEKREKVLSSPVHLVELDLLRGGQRMPTTEPLPPLDYYVLISRSPRAHPAVADFWPLSIRHRLPVIPVPLAAGDAAVPLDLQLVFDNVYDRAGYDYSIQYAAPVRPPISAADEAWIRACIEQSSLPPESETPGGQ